MGLLSYLVVKGVETASKKTLINATGMAATSVIATAAQIKEEQPDSIIKHGTLYVKPNRASSDYYGNDAITTVNELIGCGFDAVELKASKNIGSFGIKKYGKVKSVTINGQSDFNTKKKFISSAYVIVEYNEFRSSVDDSIRSKVNTIRPGIFNTIINEATFAEPKISMSQTNISQNQVYTSASALRYCMYCGKQISDSNARFCSACGKELR